MAVTAQPRAVRPKSTPTGPSFWQKLMTRKFLLISALAHVVFFVAAGYFIITKETEGGRSSCRHRAAPSKRAQERSTKCRSDESRAR